MSSPEAEDGDRRRWRPLKVVLIVLGAIVALLILLMVLVLLLLPSRAFEEKLKEEVLPRVSEKLGRQVTIQSVETSVFPPSIEIVGLRVAGSTQYPLLVAERSRAYPNLWPLIRSLGKEVGFSSIVVREPEVNLVQLRDGTWDLPRMPKGNGEGPKIEVSVRKARIRDGTVRIIRQTDGREIRVENLQTVARWEEKGLLVRTFRANAFGGEIRGDGSRLDLSGASPRWNLLTAVDGLNLDQLPAKALEGRLALQADLNGAGAAVEEVKRSLEGDVNVQLRDLNWKALNFEQSVLQQTGKVLDELGFLGGPTEEGSEGTNLGDISMKLRVKDGWMQLEEPVPIRSSFGSGVVSGRVSLDQQLDLEATTELTPEYLGRVSEGKVKLGEGVPVRAHIGGTVSEPEITDVDTTKLAPALGKEGVKEGIKEKLKIPKPKLPF